MWTWTRKYARKLRGMWSITCFFVDLNLIVVFICLISLREKVTADKVIVLYSLPNSRPYGSFSVLHYATDQETVLIHIKKALDILFQAPHCWTCQFSSERKVGGREGSSALRTPLNRADISEKPSPSEWCSLYTTAPASFFVGYLSICNSSPSGKFGSLMLSSSLTWTLFYFEIPCSSFT